MKVLVAGDFCPQNRVSSLFEQGKYYEVLDGVKDVIHDADYAMVNFECPIRLGGETPNLDRLSLFCSLDGLKAVQYAGFDCVTLANNHFRDWGDGGVISTLKCCKELGVDYVGGGENLDEARTILYKRINGEKLAIINCCEHEFSLATESRCGSNPLNPVIQYRAIIEARKNSDYVIVIVHGGHEYYQLPSPRMQETYRFFVEAGADAVVNHHQHCMSGYELYKGKPIFYGIGNFCFDLNMAKSPLWYNGYMVSFDFDREGIAFDIIPYIQCKDKAAVTIIPYEDIKEEINSLCGIIADSQKLAKKAEDYYNSCQSSVANTIEPYTNRYLKALRRRGLVPNFLTKKWLMYLCNYTMCESHRDKLEYFFEHTIY